MLKKMNFWFYFKTYNLILVVAAIFCWPAMLVIKLIIKIFLYNSEIFKLNIYNGT